MKKIQKWPVCVLAAAAAAFVLPAAASAADPGELIVNGTDIAAETDKTVECGNGTASYDEVSNTLTLTNAELTQTEAGGHSLIDNATGKELIIKLEGRNTAELNDYNGILIQSDPALTISGNGSLYMDGGNSNNYLQFIASQGSITVDGAFISMENGANTGIGSSGGNITLKNKAQITGDTGQILYARQGKLLIENSTVKTPGEGSDTGVTGFTAIWVKDLEITGSSVAAEAATAIAADGNTVISSSDVTVNSTRTAGSGNPGLYIVGSLHVTDSEIQASSAKHCGIYGGGDITITGGSIKAQAGESGYGIFSGGSLTMSGLITVDASGPRTPDYGVSSGGNGTLAIRTEENTDGTKYDVVAGESEQTAAALTDSPYAGGTDITADINRASYFKITKHVHVFDQEVIDDVYYAGGGCDSAQLYYKSCACGEAGTETFAGAPAPGYTLAHVEGKAPTASDSGYEEYWKCSVCGQMFADGAGTIPIDEPRMIPAKGSDSSGSGSTGTGGGSAQTAGTVKTGDQNSVSVWMYAVWMCAAAGVIAGILAAKKRKIK